MTDRAEAPVVPSPEEALSALVDRARAGEAEALNLLVAELVDDVYRLSLRMTANPADAEDATQEVMIKVVTHIGTFRGDASVRTWAYRIAVRHVLDQRKTRLEILGLDFARFAADLMEGLEPQPANEDPLAASEVKLGCTLAMLICLDREHRVAYILGEVFDLPSSIAAAIAEVPGQVYRQRLSRARRQLEAFTNSYCGVVNASAPCRCDKRVKRAIELGRIERDSPRLVRHPVSGVIGKVQEMEALHATAALFRGHPRYAAPDHIAGKVKELLAAGTLELLREQPGLLDRAVRLQHD
jgi:RNA polymerase sigma factor (sigma-70 family)